MESLFYAFIILIIGFALGVWFSNRSKTPADPEAAARTAAQMRTEDRLEVTQLLKAGRKIEAIKEVRERARVGLTEAKAIADHLEMNDPASGIG
ncbi:MAG: hypothetical protein WA979_09015 [Pacificimonas sp.]